MMGYFIIILGSLLMAVETMIEKLVRNTPTLPIVHKIVLFIAYVCFACGFVIDIKNEMNDVREFVRALFKHLILIGIAFLLCYVLANALIWGFFLIFVLVVFVIVWLG